MKDINNTSDTWNNLNISLTMSSEKKSATMGCAVKMKKPVDRESFLLPGEAGLDRTSAFIR